MLGDLLWSLGLMAGAVLVLVAEMFLVSFGLLALIALGLGVASVVFAFHAHAAAGWLMLLVAPLAAWWAVAWAMRRVHLGGVVVRREITAEAGYHAAAEQAGALVGAEGELVTDAMPTGRARFAHGEVDVQAQGALARGARVRVVALDGPVVAVVAAPAAHGSTAPAAP